MPGCLVLDALWQLVGFFVGREGVCGKGRALSVGKVKLLSEVLPTAKIVQYTVDIKRLVQRKFALAVADGKVLCDGTLICSAQDLRVGVFADRVP